jgi:hypothetical protein
MILNYSHLLSKRGGEGLFWQLLYLKDTVKLKKLDVEKIEISFNLICYHYYPPSSTSLDLLLSSCFVLYSHQFKNKTNHHDHIVQKQVQDSLVQFWPIYGRT